MRSRISFGGSKSGKPCDRLTAPYCMETRVMRRMTESVKPAVRSDKLCILFSSHNVRFLIVQDMFRVERRLDAVHHGEIFLRRLAQEIRTLGNAVPVLRPSASLWYSGGICSAKSRRVSSGMMLRRACLLICMVISFLWKVPPKRRHCTVAFYLSASRS